MSPTSDSFNQASVEHGELRARVSTIEGRLETVEQRQDVVLQTLAAAKGAQRFMVIIVSMLSALVGMIIAFAGIVRRWFDHSNG